MSSATATATRPADEATATTELKEALKAKIPAEQVRAERASAAHWQHTGQNPVLLSLLSCPPPPPSTSPPPPPALPIQSNPIIQQERLKALKKSIGAKEIGKVTVDMCLGGMRGIPVRQEFVPARSRRAPQPCS